MKRYFKAAWAILVLYLLDSWWLHLDALQYLAVCSLLAGATVAAYLWGADETKAMYDRVLGWDKEQQS